MMLDIDTGPALGNDVNFENVMIVWLAVKFRFCSLGFKYFAFES